MNESGRSEGTRGGRSGRARVMPGLVLILAGVIFLATSLNWIPWSDWWKYLIGGLGAILIVDALVDRVRSGGRMWGRVVAGLVLITASAALLVGLGPWWPVILIVGGVLLLAGRLVRK